VIFEGGVDVEFHDGGPCDLDVFDGFARLLSPGVRLDDDDNAQVGPARSSSMSGRDLDSNRSQSQAGASE
jgi:hypothetical protein